MRELLNLSLLIVTFLSMLSLKKVDSAVGAHDSCVRYTSLSDSVFNFTNGWNVYGYKNRRLLASNLRHLCF